MKKYTAVLTCVAAGLLSLLTAACSSSQVSSSDFVGVWVMDVDSTADVNKGVGQKFPPGATLNINSDGTLLMKVVGKRSSEIQSGTWTMSDGKLTAVGKGGSTFTATIADGKLTAVEEKSSIVFRR